jgi:protein tyrosine/serine phosphatase
MRTPLERLYNFHWVIPGEAARSAQGFAGRLDLILVRRGIRAIVNLRGRNPKYRWWRNEEAMCARLGIARFDTALDSRRLPTRDMLVKLLDAFDGAPRPLLLKCSGGQDRTSLAAAIYILNKSGWDAIGTAEAQFARYPYMHFPKAGQGWLVQFLRYAQEEAKGSPIAQWIRTAYDPEAFAAWLRAKGMGDSFAGIFTLPWTPHRRPWFAFLVRPRQKR